MFNLIDTIEAQDLAPRAVQFMVPMRDAVRLATDIYLPENPVKHAAILVRTPYDKCSRYTALKCEAEYFTQQGYVFVAQDVRGKYRSEGETMPYDFDVADAWDTIDWITAQPWSDGTVGLTGESYYGFTTWAGVASGHPAVRAAIPMVTGVNMAAEHMGTSWRQSVPQLIGLNDLIQIWTDNRSYLVDLDYATERPLTLIDEAGQQLGHSLGVNRLLECISGNCGRTAPYGDAHPYYSTKIPILHWVNWYDPGLAPEGMKDWRAFSDNPGTRHLHYLRAASADHSDFDLADVGLGDEISPYLDDEVLHQKLAARCAEKIAFFDEHVRGISPETPRARAVWHLGNAGWRASADWPPTGTTAQVLYLDRQGATGLLSPVRLGNSQTTSWVHDPGNPVPSSTSIEEIWYFLAACPDERDLAARPDVLSFVTSPLDRAFDLVGRPVLSAQVRSDAPSFHLFVKLQDVAPDGTTRQISRNQAVLPGISPEPLRLPLNDIAYRFQPGHRIQLQLQCSDYPYYLIHPGTDENPWTARQFFPSRQSLKLGGNGPASLTLPRMDP